MQVLTEPTGPGDLNARQWSSEISLNGQCDFGEWTASRQRPWAFARGPGETRREEGQACPFASRTPREGSSVHIQAPAPVQRGAGRLTDASSSERRFSDSAAGGEQLTRRRRRVCGACRPRSREVGSGLRLGPRQPEHRSGGCPILQTGAQGGGLWKARVSLESVSPTEDMTRGV